MKDLEVLFDSLGRNKGLTNNAFVSSQSALVSVSLTFNTETLERILHSPRPFGWFRATAAQQEKQGMIIKDHQKR